MYSPSDVTPLDFKLSISNSGLHSVVRPLAVNCGRPFNLTTVNSVWSFMSLAKPTSEMTEMENNTNCSILINLTVTATVNNSLVHYKKY